MARLPKFPLLLRWYEPQSLSDIHQPKATNCLGVDWSLLFVFFFFFIVCFFFSFNFVAERHSTFFSGQLKYWSVYRYIKYSENLEQLYVNIWTQLLPWVKLKHVSPRLKFDPFQKLVMKCDIINENLCNSFINYQHYQT